MGGMSFGYRQRSTGIMGSLNQMANWLTRILLLEDALSVNRYRTATYAKLFTPLLLIFREREKLQETEKTGFLCSQSRIFAGKILEYDRMSVSGKLRFVAFLICCGWWKVVYKVRYTIEKITR